MESVEKIKEFLKIEDVNHGNGCGDPIFDPGGGSNNATGTGHGSICGYSITSGIGYSEGITSSISLDSTDGDGDGGEIKIREYKGELVWYVDTIPTLIDKIRGILAKGRIINVNDFTIEDTYVIKGSNKFAHGSTPKQAKQALESKIFAELDIKTRIKEFTKVFNKTDKYFGQEFYDWHHKLTGSCEQGRDSFVYSNGLDLTEKYSVLEFIKLTEDSYEGHIIKKLKPFYKVTLK